MDCHNAGGNAAPLHTASLPITLDTLIGLDAIVGKIKPNSTEHRAFDALSAVVRHGIKAILDRPAANERVLCWKLRQIGGEIDTVPGESFEVDDEDRRRLSILVADLKRFGLVPGAKGRAAA